jgi:predicted RecB family nuclease
MVGVVPPTGCPRRSWTLQQSAAGVRYSATDLVTWLGCSHASWLDASTLTDPGLRGLLRRQREQAQADLDSGLAFPEPSAGRGAEHEAAMLAGLVAQGLKVVTVPDPKAVGLEAAVAATNDAMTAGADVVFQAALRDDPWIGIADFLVRVDGPRSRFGDYAYEIRDTKLARHATANALVQMAHYGAMLELVQGAPPPRLVRLARERRHVRLGLRGRRAVPA